MLTRGEWEGADAKGVDWEGEEVGGSPGRGHAPARVKAKSCAATTRANERNQRKLTLNQKLPRFGYS